MRLTPLVPALIAASLAMPAGASVLTDTYSSFWVLGDSLSDPGNLAALTGGVAPGPDYPTGRFSNGPVFAEYLQGDFAAAGRPAANFAFGGATAAPADPGDPPGLPEQTALFELFSAGARGSRPLVSVFFGSNDIFEALGGPDVIAAAEAAADAVIAAASAIAAGDGVQDFVLYTLPDIGRTPAYRLFQPALAADATAASLAFNSRLAGEVGVLRAAGARVTTVDIFGAFTALLDDPSAIGLADATLPCVFPSDGIAALFGQPRVCDAGAAATRVFYDGVHPTKGVHAYFAGAVEAAVTADVAAVPLPATLPLAMLGLGALAMIRRRRPA